MAFRQGDFDRADAALGMAHDTWIQLGNRVGLARALMLQGVAAEYRGDETTAQSRYEEALALYRACDDLPGVTDTLYCLADAAYRRGDLAEAATLAEQAVIGSREADLPVLLVTGLVTVGACASALGDGQRAVSALREALTLARDLGSRMWVASALVGLADVAVAAGDASRGARLLGAADGLTDRIGVPTLPHHALHRRVHATARAALGEDAFAAGWADGKALSLETAIAEAQMVTGAIPPSRSDLFTPRERDVLRLLVAGRTDREIGEALFVGKRTVEGHVAHILAKLDVHTRGAAVAAALAAGLVEPSPPEEP
jgi:DNA-binding CsgD family transcriptional regulator